MPRLSMPATVRLVGMVVMLVLLLLTAGAIENGRADAQPPCTHGASSLGPIEFQDGHVVGGPVTPVTETCLP